MDKDYEEKFVKTFFVKSLQERATYELLSSKKRQDALNRLCHNYKNTLNEKYFIKVESSSYLEILSLLTKSGSGDNCYSISFNKDIDGKYLPLKTALEKSVGYGLPSIIVCTPDKLAYFEAEQESGAPPRFILKKV